MPTPQEELEWQTRRDRINTKLTSLPEQWKIIRFREGLNVATLTHHAVEEYPTEKGPADYALFVKGNLLGIIEAKKVTVAPQNVLEQAKRYSRGVTDGVGNWNGFRVPFLYATNGEVIYHVDVRNESNTSRKLSNFHTPCAIEEFYSKEFEFSARVNEPLQDLPRMRPYQRAAVLSVEAAIRQGKRSMLVAMATGTGKTYLTVAQIYRLMKSGVAKRILFMVDRKALAAQAVRELNSFNTPTGNKFSQEYEVYSQRFRREDFGEEEAFDPKVLPNSYLTAPQAKHTFVYVSTVQRMAINLFGWQNSFEQGRSDPDYEEEADKMDIPIHAFDLVIADECHRGYTASETAVWRSVMEYFDAIKIGLTATPAPHSLTLFNEVVYRYTTEQAIEDGYLVDYEPVKISSNVLMKGAFLKEGEHVVVVDTQTGQETYDTLEDERQFPAEEIEHKITAPETNKLIIKEIAKYAHAHELETGRFPKILIFAVNDLPHTSHADQIVDICRKEFGQGDAFVQKITGSPSVDRPLQRIREFRNRPNPKIVVTVDMLSTGVDIPQLEFVVFMRPVRSRILWVQMLGRGTRLCPDINKTHFKVFDCFDGTLIQYFQNTTDFKIEPPAKEPLELAQIIENIYQNVDRDYHANILVKRLRRIEKDMSGNAREKFAGYIPDGDIGKFAGELKEKLKKDFTVTMKLLRDETFQDSLLNYERMKRSFWVGPEIVDEVTSEEMISFDGKLVKPEDYLVLFSKFVKENPEHIEAIKILMERPKDWRTDVLNDLRTKLQKANFPEKELQKAHRKVYHKELADIISMVKHAAKEEEAVLTAEERVERAMQRFVKGKKFSDEQLKWLGYIKEHLAENLTLEVSDFDVLPIFEQRGGLRVVRRVLGEDVEKIVDEINLSIAA